MDSTRAGPVVVPRTLHDRVREAARRDPDAVALVEGQQRLPYGALVAAADAWTGILLAHGVGRGEVVAVRAGRELDLPAALLGLLGAGACYSVVDPEWPAERQAELLSRMGARTSIGHPGAGPLVAGMAELPLLRAAELALRPGCPPRAVDADAAACLFWTSGSTGRPKGVLSPHRATTRLVGTAGDLPSGPGRVMLAAAAPGWDAFSLELWAMLTTGGTTVLHRPSYLLPDDLRDAVREHGVNELYLTSGLFDVFVTEDAGCFDGLDRVIVGGDRMSPEHAGTFLKAHPGTTLRNGYGPVECCVFVTTHRVIGADLARPEGVPIGSPVPGTGVLVVDGGRVVPRGEEGEVWITGQAVGLGYLGEPEATADRFGAFGSVPCYRTGDRARMDGDGTLLFLGRADRQLKIAGHRVEPAEVEAVVIRLGCRQAAVVAVPGLGVHHRLALFAVRGSYPGTPRELRADLAGRLPRPMVPWPIRFLDELPLTSNAKVDRAELAQSVSGWSGRASAQRTEEPADVLD